MPTKRLPPRPNLEHLKSQARDLIAACASGDAAARQRLREFHPRFSRASDEAIAAAALGWSDALLAIAREYGFASWPRLKRKVAEGDAEAPAAFTDRIGDAALRQAVELVDDGDIEELRLLIGSDPSIVGRRANFEGENYFRAPALLAFIAENPVRNDALPPNIVEVTEFLLDAGAGKRQADLDETLSLVASGRVARECGAQGPLIALLCRRGADADAALSPALAHGEFEAARALVAAGARPGLAYASATGDEVLARRLLAASAAEERHLALALAAMHRRARIAAMLLDAGEDPNLYNPVGAHSHSTPLHQAAWNGDMETVRVLIDGGARLDLKDAIWNGTPREWALHAGRREVAAHLLRMEQEKR